ncbi:hypothetical protein ACHAW6_000867, partial [Cyclotella cf. meneghiniana]
SNGQITTQLYHLNQRIQILFGRHQNFYLCTPLKQFEYIRMHLSDFPEDVIEQYTLKELANKDGMLFLEILKGVYGLPQAGLLAQELLEKQLNKHRYFQSTRTPGLWTPKWQPVQFTLVVDNFGIKYVDKDNLHHLTAILQEHYKISIDKTGSQYVGIDTKYTLPMPGYVQKALK